MVEHCYIIVFNLNVLRLCNIRYNPSGQVCCYSVLSNAQIKRFKYHKVNNETDFSVIHTVCTHVRLNRVRIIIIRTQSRISAKTHFEQHALYLHNEICTCTCTCLSAFEHFAKDVITDENNLSRIIYN